MTGNNEPIGTSDSAIGRSFSPFRRAVFRGLAIIMPPLLTLILFLWAGNLILNNVLRPIEKTSRQIIVWVRGDLRTDQWAQKELAKKGEASGRLLPADHGEKILVQMLPSNGQMKQQQWIQIDRMWIRKEVFESVENNPGIEKPTTAEGYCHRYAQLQYLKPQITIPLFFAVFVLLLYLVGKFLAVGVGKMIWGWIESVISRIPMISNVYSSVKQVTDFALSENEIQFTRVVGVEYPRRGIWSIGFATSDSLEDLRNVAGEPMMSVLMPTSPMPATGFTISVPKSQTIDLNITMDQAIQFVVSCGVVVPKQKSARARRLDVAKLKVHEQEENKHNFQNQSTSTAILPTSDLKLNESDGFKASESD